MKMREALVAMVEAETEGSMDRDDLCGRCFEKMWDSCKHDGSCWVDKVINALSDPPRNCDVGTAEEQEERMVRWCGQHKCESCQFFCVANDGVSCEFTWGQSPYEAEGESDEQK